MVALKTYTPQSLGFDPYNIATQLAAPIDYNGTLKALQEWNSLANNEATADFNQARAEEEAFKQSQRDEYRKTLESTLAENPDPMALDPMKIAAQVKDYESLLKLSQERKKAEAEAPMKMVEAISKLGKAGKFAPELTQTLAQQIGATGFKVPEQKSEEKSKGNKEKVLVNPDTQEFRVEGSADGFLDPKNVEKIAELVDSGYRKQGAPAPTATPDPVSDFDSFLNKMTGYAPTPSPTATASPVPSGGDIRQKYQALRNKGVSKEEAGRILGIK